MKNPFPATALATTPATILAAALALLTAGCATSAPAAKALAAGADASGYMTTLDVWGDRPRVEYSKQHQLRLPAKLAVGSVASEGHAFANGSRSERQVQFVEAFTADAETYRDVVSLTGHDIRSRDGRALEQLRNEAAPHQADLLVVVSREERVVEGHNAFAFLKLLLLPMLFVPTESDEIELSMHVAMVDARNGLIYTTWEGRDERTLSATVVGEGDAVEETFDEMYTSLSATMVDQLGRKLRAQTEAGAN